MMGSDVAVRINRMLNATQKRITFFNVCKADEVSRHVEILIHIRVPHKYETGQHRLTRQKAHWSKSQPKYTIVG